MKPAFVWPRPAPARIKTNVVWPRFVWPRFAWPRPALPRIQAGFVLQRRTLPRIQSGVARPHSRPDCARRRPGARALAGAALALLCLLQLWCLWRAPAAWSPAAIVVALAPGESIVLGRRELAAPQADWRHLRLRRDAAGRWWLRNLSTDHPLWLQRRDGDARRVGTSGLAPGQQWRIGAAQFGVLASEADTVEFARDGQHWRFDGATVLRDGAPQPPCPGATALADLVGAWNRRLPAALTLARPLTFGGNLSCGNRVGIAHVAPASATLARIDGRLLLAGGTSEAASAPLMLGVGVGADAHNLAQQEEALDEAAAVIAGRTRLALSLDDGRATLRPSGHVALSAAVQAALPPPLHWEWRRRSDWAAPAGTAWLPVLALCAGLAAAAALAWQRGAWPFLRTTGAAVRAAGAASALLAAAGIGALLLAHAGTPPAPGVSVLLGCAALWCCLLAPARLSLAGGAGALLLAVGLLSQLDLGLGATNSSWLRHFQKSAALLAIGAGIGTQLLLRWRGGGAVMAQAQVEWALALLAVGALAALLLQVLCGDETGVFGLQPVELAKLALTALTAHCLAVGQDRRGDRTGSARSVAGSWRLAAPALLFGALLALALVEVDDYSPLILLLIWSVAMALTWSLAARNGRTGLALLTLCVLAISAIAALRGAAPADIAGVGFYADRFLVWIDPAGHPHTGQQMLLGARAIAEGGWWGSDQRLGLSSFGQAAGAALRVPAVQDDFAASFFVNRHGLVSALALWTLQVLFLAGLLRTAWRAFAAASAARDFRQAWLGRFRCFALCGGAAFVLGHFLLSWGTNLAIFPIMGQPMSFLSAGGSHLLFFICPLLAFSAISAQSLEEN